MRWTNKKQGCREGGIVGRQTIRVPSFSPSHNHFLKNSPDLSLARRSLCIYLSHGAASGSLSLSPNAHCHRFLYRLIIWNNTRRVFEGLTLHTDTVTLLSHKSRVRTTDYAIAEAYQLKEINKLHLQGGDDDGGDANDDDYSGNLLLDSELESVSGDGIEIEIEELGQNSRRIRSRIAIDASLPTIWNILTDYERLADFIPGLAVSQLIEKRDNFARLFQIGQQKLAFGLKFNAKGIVDCYEKDLESILFGQRRDIEFKMIEGDFQIFEGRWSIEQYNNGRREGNSDSSLGQEFHTTLSYVVDVKPKLWLPVGLVEGRLCREIKTNLSCIREEAQKAIQNTLPI